MIEIIKYPEERKRKQFKCPHCGTEWIADAADYDTKLIEEWIDNIQQVEYFTLCPICGYYCNFSRYEENKFWKDVDIDTHAGIYDIYFLPGKSINEKVLAKYE